MEATKTDSKLAVGIMYFSPTGATRRVCEAVARGISSTKPIHIDLTRNSTSNVCEVDVLVIGAPVYASRIPSIAQQRILSALKDFPAKTPAVAVVTYGNVEVGIALKELVNLLKMQGLVVVGAGEFVGMHYFKHFHGLNPKGSLNRPDKDDLVTAKQYGEMVLRKGFEALSAASALKIDSAKVPFRFRSASEERVLGTLCASEVDVYKCSGCMACVKVCPVGCIDAKTFVALEGSGCLGCGACMRVCPTAARSQRMHKLWLVKFLAKPKNPAGKPVICL